METSNQRTPEELKDVEYNYFRYYRIKPSEKNVQNIDAIIKKKASDTNPKNPRLARDLKNDAVEILVHDATYNPSTKKYIPNSGGRKKELLSLKSLSLQNALGYLSSASKSTKIVLPSLIQKVTDSPENRISNEEVFTFDELASEAEQKGFWVFEDDILDELMPKDDEFAPFDGLDIYYSILGCSNLYEFLGISSSASENEIIQAKARKVKEGATIPASNLSSKKKKEAYSKLNGKVGLVLQKPDQRKMYDYYISFYADIWSVFKDKKQFNDFDLDFDQFSFYVSLIAKRKNIPMKQAGRILLVGVRHYGLRLKFGNEEEKVELSVEEMLSKAEVLLEDGKYEKADRLLEKVLYKEAKNGPAYLLKLLVENRCGKIEQLKNASEPIETCMNYHHAYEFGDESQKRILSLTNQAIIKRKQEEAFSTLYSSAMKLKAELKYQEASQTFSKILDYRDSKKQAEECLNLGNEAIYQKAMVLKAKKEYQEAISLFGKVKDYKSSAMQINDCRNLYVKNQYLIAMDLKKKERYDEAYNLFRSVANYFDSKTQMEDCLRLKEIKRKETMYHACLFEGEIAPAKDYSKLKKSCTTLKSIPGYKDSKILLSKYEKIIKDYEAECEREREEFEKAQKKKKKKIKIISIASSSGALVLTGVLLLTFLVFVPNGRENTILKLIDSKNYSEATSLLEKNGNYGDGQNLLSMCNAGKAFDNLDYETGIDYIYNIGGTIDVSYDGNGGTATKANERIKKANQYIDNDALFTGYDFSRWVLKDYSLDSKNHSASLSLQAVYDLVSYEITYDLDGGTGVNLPSSYDCETALSLPNPEKKGYTFLGWTSLDLTTPTKDYTLPKGSVGKKNYKANWKANDYTVYLDSNQGEISKDEVKVTYDASYSFPLPTREGYTFYGWQDEKGNVIQTEGIYQYDEDLHLKAIWNAKSYSITYLLDGGINASSNPSSYTIEKEVHFSSPTKNGYTFNGWYSNGSLVTSIPKGSTGDIVLEARWTIITYSIDYHLNGGTNVSSNPISYTIETETISLSSPSKVGYTFQGWYLDSSYTSKCTKITKGSHGNLDLYAKWECVEYTITYNLDGGTNASSNPSKYTIEDEVTLSSPTKEGYTFVGWYSDGKKVTGIQKGSAGNRVFDAKWQAELNQLSVTSEDTSKGSVMIVSGQGYTGETITIKASANENYSFGGWYDGTKKVSNQETYSFVMPASDVSLVAHFLATPDADEQRKMGILPSLDENTNTITYGIYPQTHVSDRTLLSSLNTLTTAEENGYYLYNGSYYAKKNASPYESTYAFEDGTVIASGTAYWFKCEPIKWKILSSEKGEYSLVSSLVLDAHRYNASYDGRVNGSYANNYKNSEIRSWLNSDFYQTAFSLDSSSIQLKSVDNSASTTSNGTNRYACEDTSDNLYLLSYQEYKNVSYFADDSARAGRLTDYAIASGAVSKTSGNIKNCSTYWTRSPDNSFARYVNDVNASGNVETSVLNQDTYGVRPGMTIKI